MRWSTEKQFDKHYYGTEDAQQKLTDLAEWRNHQIATVGKLKDIIKLVSSEQYSALDHFVLELLQNADDNTYAAGRIPTVRMELFKDRLEVTNNEKGFSDEDVYSITYAAASTKRREATAATYIGEKGIGFKSVFAISEWVDVHSNGYHFRLKNNEFVVPHPVESIDSDETRIVLWFRSDREGIAKTLSKRLRQVGQHSQQFLLFLQKLKRLEIIDHIANKKTMIEASKAPRSADVVVSNGRRKQAYLRTAFQKTLPKKVVQTRYSELMKPLPRETVIAVPVPEKETALPDSGKLFCFLPTRVNTSIPLHIQVDGKTTTNRENILEFRDSPWNKAIFADLADCLVSTYLKLTEDKRFHARLPEYWPPLDGDVETGNNDMDAIVVDVAEKLTEQPIILDRHGEFRCPGDVYLVPEGWERLLSEDKYEEELGDGTFVAEAWSRKYRDELVAIGVEELYDWQFVNVLGAGVPVSVSKGSETSQRRFLAKATSAVGHYYLGSLKACPIFPLVSDGETRWGNLEGDVLWVKTETPTVPDTLGITVIDPRFTYMPGGSAKKTGAGQALAGANRRFREFLQEDLKIPPFSEAELLKRTVVERLQKFEEEDLRKVTVRREIGGLWKRLFVRVWRRRKTLQKEIGEEALQDLFEKIEECQITIRANGKGKWGLASVDECFLGKPFVANSKLEKVFKGTGIPIVQLEFDSAKAKTKGKGRRNTNKKKTDEWKGWREFLLKVGAHTGPHLCTENLKGFMPGSYVETIRSRSKHYPRLKRAVDSAVKDHYEFYGSRYNLRFSTTTSLDAWTIKALAAVQTHEYVANALKGIRDDLEKHQTKISFCWGNNRNSRHAKTDVLAVNDQLAEKLTLSTSLGPTQSVQCFAATPINKRVLSGVAPVLDDKKVMLPDDLLDWIGLHGDVTVNDLQKLIKAWVGESEGGEVSRDFDLFLDAIANFLEWRPDQTEEALKILKVWDTKKEKLVPLKTWITVADAPTCAASARLVSLIDSGSLQSPSAAVDAFFAISDIAVQTDVAIFRLAGIGKRASVDQEFAKDVRDLFDKQLLSKGLKCYGKKMTRRSQLPFIWVGDKPLGKVPKQVLAVTNRAETDLAHALSVLEWSSSNDGGVRVVQDKSLAALSAKTAARVIGSVSVLAELMTGTESKVAEKLRSNRFFQGKADAIERISQSKMLKLRLTWGRKNAEVRVPFWAEPEHLYLDAGHSIQNSLAAYIDRAANSTVAWAFDGVWNSYEVENFVDSGLDSPEAPMSPPKHPDQRDPSIDKDGGGPTGIAGDIFGEESGSDDADETLSDSKTSRDGPRARLRSMVMTGGGSKGPGGGSDADSGETDDKDNEVEKKGVELFTQKFEEMGATVDSRESENVGWDFDVTLGDVTLNIELKSSRDKWSGWEHALTKNEFLKALNVAENYYLCAIDQVFGESPQFFFINDPANAVDEYLFDHPWKSRALGLDSLEAQLKAKSGAIED